MRVSNSGQLKLTQTPEGCDRPPMMLGLLIQDHPELTTDYVEAHTCPHDHNKKPPEVDGRELKIDGKLDGANW